MSTFSIIVGLLLSEHILNFKVRSHGRDCQREHGTTHQPAPEQHHQQEELRASKFSARPTQKHPTKRKKINLNAPPIKIFEFLFFFNHAL